MSHHQIVPEAARLQYLDAIGVASWLPLANQLSTHGAVWQDASEFVALETEAEEDQSAQFSSVGSAPSQVETVAVGSNSGDMQPSFDEPPPLGISAEQAKEEASQLRHSLMADNASLGVEQGVQKPQTAQQAVVAELAVPVEPRVVDRIEPVHLSFSWYAVGVLVLNEVPLQDGAAMTSSLAQLQTAMVNALALGEKQVMPQAQGEFHWPLIPGKHGDHSRSGAQEALAYQLNKLLAEKMVIKVMLLGQRSADLIIGDGVELGSLVASEQWPEAQILLTHSLHQLLKIPANKAEAWLHMQLLLDA